MCYSEHVEYDTMVIVRKHTVATFRLDHDYVTYTHSCQRISSLHFFPYHTKEIMSKFLRLKTKQIIIKKKQRNVQILHTYCLQISVQFFKV